VNDTVENPQTIQALLLHRARVAWQTADPRSKCDLVFALDEAVAPGSTDKTGIAERISTPCSTTPIMLDDLEPGRPDRPSLVHPAKVAKRQTGRAGGRGSMLHAIAHIEFNAINLALDAVWRYPNMPLAYTRDWVSVAVDEARHFNMLCDELQNENLRYGDFDAHDGLWAMARRTAHDLIARMALVPRVLEARGLDATPVIQRKLDAIGDQRGVAVLQQLLDEEIRHVRIGDFWFRQLCASSARDAETAYRELLQAFEAPLPKSPMNCTARLEAGFSQAELDWLATAGRSG